MRTQRRAAFLGAMTTVATTALTVWLVRLSVDQWPGRGQVPMDGALGFLTVAAAAALTTWASVVLAAATAPLLGPLRTGGTGLRVVDRGTGDRPGGSSPVPRVTAALLAAAALSLGSTAAQAVQGAVPAVHVLHHEPEGAPSAPQPGGPQPGSSLPAGTSGPTPLSDVEAVPVPGWTPTPDPTRGTRPTSGKDARVDLVTTSQERAASSRAAGEDHVVVHRGDTLWSIAARHLGAHATDADVAEAWPRWYAANRDQIGDDPDLLLPGQVLELPAGADR